MINSTLFNRLTLTRLIAAGLALVILALPVAALAAPTAQEIRELGESKEVKDYFGEDDISKDRYRALPEDGENAKDAKIFICPKKTDPCDPEKDGVPFVVHKIDQVDNDDGEDKWTYLFTPEIDSKKVNPKLQFVYKQTGGTEAQTGLTLNGDQIKGEYVDQGKFSDLEDFRDTNLGKLLDKKADKDTVKEFGLPEKAFTTDQTKLLDRGGGDDPFAKAIAKLAEVVLSLNSSMTEVLLATMDVGNLDNVNGLKDAWLTIRTLVNVLFLLVLVTIALTTILRIDTKSYSIHSLLPLLVFGIIAVNFSLLFANIMTNSAYVLGQPFLDSAKGLIETGATRLPEANGDLSFGAAIVLLIAAVIMLIALAVLLFFFIIRVIVIWFLAALSPLLFLLMVLPLTRSLSKDLFKSWVKWVYLAPIAFIILYIGARVAVPVLDGEQFSDEGSNALYHALFYAGAVIAAVAIPIQLGGRIAQLATRHGKRAGMIGGKGGLAALGAVPGVGEVKRTGQQFLKQREDSQTGRAAERAAEIGGELHRQLGQGGLATAITGRDLTQAESATEQLVDKDLKEMQLVGYGDKDMRDIVYAKNGWHGMSMSDLSPDKQAFAKSYVGERAAAKGLAASGWWSQDQDMANQYAHLGYQSLIKDSDPLIGHLKKERRRPGQAIGYNDINGLDMAIQLANTQGDKMGSIIASTWDYADPNSSFSRANPGAHRLFSQVVGEGFDTGGGKRLRVNTVAMNQTADFTHRNATAQNKRESYARNFRHFGREVQRSIVEGNITSGSQFLPLNGGPQSIAQAQQWLRDNT